MVTKAMITAPIRNIAMPSRIAKEITLGKRRWVDRKSSVRPTISTRRGMTSEDETKRGDEQ